MDPEIDEGEEGGTHRVGLVRPCGMRNIYIFCVCIMHSAVGGSVGMLPRGI